MWTKGCCVANVVLCNNRMLLKKYVHNFAHKLSCFSDWSVIIPINYCDLPMYRIISTDQCNYLKGQLASGLLRKSHWLINVTFRLCIFSEGSIYRVPWAKISADWHMYGFKLECKRIWALRFLGSTALYSQILHLCTTFLCTSSCFFRTFIKELTSTFTSKLLFCWVIVQISVII